MKRSDINHLIRSAEKCFINHGWTLPPHPRWDVTDFGLGAFRRYGLVLINLAEEPEYCEKLMYALKNMTTPAHTHKKKKEDIICRWGQLDIVLWKDQTLAKGETISLKVNGRNREVRSGQPLGLPSAHSAPAPDHWRREANHSPLRLAGPRPRYRLPMPQRIQPAPRHARRPRGADRESARMELHRFVARELRRFVRRAFRIPSRAAQPRSRGPEDLVLQHHGRRADLQHQPHAGERGGVQRLPHRAVDEEPAAAREHPSRRPTGPTTKCGWRTAPSSPPNAKSSAG